MGQHGTADSRYGTQGQPGPTAAPKNQQPARDARARMRTRRATVVHAISSPKQTATEAPRRLDREVASEGEALVEALRLGVTYYAIQEFRVIPDFAGRRPQLKKEAVHGK